MRIGFGTARTTALVALTSLVSMLGVAQVSAVPSPDFYAVPDSVAAGAPGDLIRSEPMNTLLSVPTPTGTFPADATRIMYRTTDPDGSPTASTGVVLDPVAVWGGAGERPLVSLSVGTHGIGPQCGTSSLLEEGVHYRPPFDLFAEYETPFIDMLLTQGIAVVVTDYVPNRYLDPRSEGPAVIDAARAAQRAPGNDIPDAGPVAFWGYSQGGQAAGAAAEQVSAYAPELDVKGTFVGAAPADMLSLLEYLDGSLLTGVMGYYLNSLKSSDPSTAPVIDSALNEAGHGLLNATAGQCVLESMGQFGLHKSTEYTVDGRSIPDVLRTHPETAGVVDSMRLGNSKPSAPVLLATGGNDDIVPAEDVRRLGGDWCSKGSAVQLLDLPIPTVLPGSGLGHAGNLPVAALGTASQWLNDRFNGVPVPSNCAAE